MHTLREPVPARRAHQRRRNVLMVTIAAAVILEGPKALHQGGLTNELMSGVVASAISGWLAISILMRYVSRHSYGIFAAYRIVLGIAVLAVVYARG